MADKRAFAKFDVGYLDNPKMLDVLDASSNATGNAERIASGNATGNAALMHMASVLYSAQHLTDGVVSPGTMQRKFGGNAADARLLVDANLWHEPGHDCDSCPQPPENRVYVHDYLEHNRSSDEALDKSTAAQRAAKARWSKDAKGNASRNAERIADRNAEREEREERDTSTLASAAADAAFEKFWAAYPKKVGKQAAVKAYKKALKAADAATLMDALDTYVKATRSTERRFIANPATWLNEGRWDDELPEPQEAFDPWTA